MRMTKTATHIAAIPYLPLWLIAHPLSLSILTGASASMLGSRKTIDVL